jgi:hypothetical protein
MILVGNFATSEAGNVRYAKMPRLHRCRSTRSRKCDDPKESNEEASLLTTPMARLTKMVGLQYAHENDDVLTGGR